MKSVAQQLDYLIHDNYCNRSRSRTILPPVETGYIHYRVWLQAFDIFIRGRISNVTPHAPTISIEVWGITKGMIK